MHTSTYRLQINSQFTLEAARELIPYLKRLGVGAAYLSPVFKAVPGSLHGYDVCDPNEINPEAGGESALERFLKALEKERMGCLLDIVPNHMSSDPACNAWWWSVLEQGKDSPFADFFDIDWNSKRTGLRGKVLLPVLGKAYGEVLESGELRVERRGNRGDGKNDWVVTYFDAVFPLNAGSVAGLSAPPEDRDALHALLEAQHYQLSNWKTALHEANYRRFFDVSTLLGVRMENDRVFEAAHGLLRRLVATGRVTGVRVDHVDGLRDPAGYIQRLRELMARENPGAAPYLVVEKILQEEETIPADWQVEGTTGYEFLSDLNGLFIAPRGLDSLRTIARKFQGAVADAASEVACKRLVLSRIMRSELNQLADQLDRLTEKDRVARDFTRDDLRVAVRETMAALSVYRTYGRDGFLSPFDAQAFEAAVEKAARANPWMESSVFVFLRDTFLSFRKDSVQREIPREDRLRFALRFQQTTGSVTAKGVEDTAFYRNPALLSLHEVGSSPRLRDTTVARFHDRMTTRLRDFPLAMLASSTHDVKRGENARAHLNALTAHSAAWRVVLTGLSRQLDAARRRAGLTLSDEHILYQSLLGAWPMNASGLPALVDEDFFNRVQAGWTKAVREAKQSSDWVKPNEDYEARMQEFLNDILRGPGFPAFSRIFFPLLTACARDGMRISLAQVACKCAVPGIPDVYQGSEFWDLSLVDPDNRRPVDFAPLAASLEKMAEYIEPDADPRDRAAFAAGLLEAWPAGSVKQYVLARCLRWRERHADVFRDGSYEALETTGLARETLAFRRALGGRELLAVIPLRAKSPGIGLLLFPDFERGRTYVNLFTGTRFTVSDKGRRAGIELAMLWKDFPAAWLWRES